MTGAQTGVLAFLLSSTHPGQSLRHSESGASVESRGYRGEAPNTARLLGSNVPSASNHAIFSNVYIFLVMAPISLQFLRLFWLF